MENIITTITKSGSSASDFHYLKEICLCPCFHEKFSDLEIEHQSLKEAEDIQRKELEILTQARATERETEGSRKITLPKRKSKEPMDKTTVGGGSEGRSSIMGEANYKYSGFSKQKDWDLQRTEADDIPPR